MNIQLLRDYKGMSLVEILVVVGLMTITMFAMMSFMSTQYKEAKALNESLARTELQRYLLTTLSDGAICTAELANPSLFTAGALPYTLNTDDLAANSIELTSIHAAAVATAPIVIQKNAVVNVGSNANLEVSSILFKNFISTGASDKYMADLQVSFTPSSMVRPLKPATLKVIVTANSGPSNARVINSCLLASKADAKQTCLDLGGQWLEATESGRFMPVPRCNMTDDIFLNTVENPDGIPTNGTANADGAAITECYYGATRNSTYKCTTRVGGTFTADVCAYDSGPKQWKVIRYVGGSPTSTVRRICNRGVLLSKKSFGVMILNWDEPIEEAIPTLGSADWIEKANYLQTASQCRVHSRVETWKACKNPLMPNAPKAGEVGSCIYVNNGKLNLPDPYNTYLSYYNADNDPDIDSSNYTGWIYVNSARSIKLTVGGLIAIKEARGIPCYGIEINTENVPNPLSKGSSTPMDASMLGSPALASRVNSCMVTSNTTAVGDNPGTRNTMLSCDQTSVVDPMPIASADIDDIRDQFPIKSCWYFNNVSIKNYSTVFSYVGWMYIQGNLPTGTTMDASDRFINVTKPIVGVPCRPEGIQFE